MINGRLKLKNCFDCVKVDTNIVKVVKFIVVCLDLESIYISAQNFNCKLKAQNWRCKNVSSQIDINYGETRERNE